MYFINNNIFKVLNSIHQTNMKKTNKYNNFVLYILEIQFNFYVLPFQVFPCDVILQRYKDDYFGKRKTGSNQFCLDFVSPPDALKSSLG